MTPIKRKLAAQEILYREGDLPRSFFIIRSGAISLFTQACGERARLGPNQVVGELAYFHPQPRTSCAKALVETELIEFPYQDIQNDSKTLPAWAQLLMKNFSEQISRLSREGHQTQSQEPSSHDFSIDDVIRLTAIVRLAGVTLMPPNEPRISWDKVKEYVLQVFRDSPTRTGRVLQALARVGWATLHTSGDEVEAVGEIHLDAVTEFENFVRHYRHSRSAGGVIEPKESDVRALTTLVELAKDLKTDFRGTVRVSMADAVAASNGQLKADHFDGLAARGLPMKKESADGAIYLSFHFEEFARIRTYWIVLLDIRPPMAS